jgi:hypothetical protein
MPKTLAELMNDPNATIGQLKVMFDDYARTGSSIQSIVVIELIERLKPDGYDKKDLLRSAEVGQRLQKVQRHPNSEEEYLAVIRHLKQV